MAVQKKTRYKPMAKKIKILKDGPYEVTPDVPLKINIIEIDAEGTSEAWLEGDAYPKQEAPYHLCRCGHSKNKPYCDGAHAHNGFDGTETAGHEDYLTGAKLYKGETIDIIDKESLCASMRFCDRGARAWNAAIHSADPENRELAIQECADCASGRLTIVEKDGTFHEPDLPEEIGLVQDTAAGWRGPLWVKGGIPVEGADGEAYEARNRMTLCRCGESSNMPFCDTSHLRCPHMQGFDEKK
jgi:CDGSH-type Zn-finger protein